MRKATSNLDVENKEKKRITKIRRGVGMYDMLLYMGGVIKIFKEKHNAQVGEITIRNGKP